MTIETVLARLYVDERFRTRFLRSPEAVALAEGLGETDARALAAIDREGLALAAASFTRKREKSRRHRRSLVALAGSLWRLVASLRRIR